MAQTTTKKASTTRAPAEKRTGAAAPKAERAKVSAVAAAGQAPLSRDVPDTYELPLVHAKVNAPLVDATFWGGLAGAALIGLVDPPVAIALGAGILVARHHATHSSPSRAAD